MGVRKLFSLLLLLMFCVTAWAQPSPFGGGGFVYIGALAGIPGTCSVGQIAFITNATPGQNQYNCASANAWTQNLNSGAGGASTALDNLAAVNINTSLLPQTGVALGSATKTFSDVFLNLSGTYGTNYAHFTGTPTGVRAITVPDANSTLVVPDTGAANNYISAISAAGAITKSRPACATLSDSASGCSAAAGITQLTGDVTAGAGSGSQAATIAAAAVTLAKMANLANGTRICRTTAGTGVPEACTAAQEAALLIGQTLFTLTTTGSSGAATYSGGTLNIPQYSGGGGTPGGSNTQCQYNNSGAFGGITGCTTNGTAVTLVAPVLGTPASGTMTNVTGLPPGAVTSAQGNGAKFQFSTGTTTTNDCVKFDVNGNTVDAGGPCSASPISGATTTAIVTAASATTIQTPSATTTLDSSGNISTPGTLSAGVGGSVGGYVSLGQGTATTAPTSSVGFMAPTSVTTKYMMTLPAAPTTGFLYNTGTTDPSTISFHAIVGADLPNPSASTLGGVESLAAISHNFLTSISTSGVPTQAQPTFADLAAGTAGAVATFPGGDLSCGGVDAQSGTSYTIVAGDACKLTTYNNAASVAVTLPQATGAGFTSGFSFYQYNRGAGAVTITPTTSTINGGSTITLNQNQGALIMSDGTNYSAWISSAPSGSGTVTSATIAGTANQITASGTCTITTTGTCTLSLPAAVILGTDNSAAGTLQLANGSAAAHTILGSAATTTNTVNFFAAVPTTGHLIDCTVSTTVCTMHDSGVVTANVVNASSPGVGLAHFAGSTQTATSSLVVSADLNITTTTCTAPQVLTAISATAVGTCTAPLLTQNSQSAAYTTVLGDAGKQIYHPGADTTARTWTIDSNANVAYSIGTCISFFNDTSAGVITIAITSDTLVLAGAGTTGSRTLAASGEATACKMTSTRWMINGTGLT